MDMCYNYEFLWSEIIHASNSLVILLKWVIRPIHLHGCDYFSMPCFPHPLLFNLILILILIHPSHYIDVIMTTIASQITSLTVVYSIVYSDADQRKHQSSASLASVWGSHRDRWVPRTKGQLRGKYFHLMRSSCPPPPSPPHPHYHHHVFVIVITNTSVCHDYIIKWK